MPVRNNLGSAANVSFNRAAKPHIAYMSAHGAAGRFCQNCVVADELPSFCHQWLKGISDQRAALTSHDITSKNVSEVIATLPPTNIASAPTILCRSSNDIDALALLLPLLLSNASSDLTGF